MLERQRRELRQLHILTVHAASCSTQHRFSIPSLAVASFQHLTLTDGVEMGEGQYAVDQLISSPQGHLCETKHQNPDDEHSKYHNTTLSKCWFTCDAMRS